MLSGMLPCVMHDASALPMQVVRPAGLAETIARLPEAQRGWLLASGFAGKPGELALLPGADGLAGGVFGIGTDRAPHIFGELPFRLPPGSVWRLLPGDYDADAAVLGFCLGAYRFRRFKAPAREPAALSLDTPAPRAMSLAAAIWMVRDLVNTPPNLLGPAELADATIDLAERYGANPYRVDAERLARDYPAVFAVGIGSERPPVVAGFSWRGSSATDSSPLIALCGKGVCFDTGGYDIKPADGMLRMKKDMGGAATVLGMARVLMDADLPLRLLVRVGCVENSISGRAMRPSDVIATRRGLSVEVGNTDAEGRLVLADLLAEASDARPDLLIDCATLTGAARVALGPDIVPMFTDDTNWAEWLAEAGSTVHDPMWRLPIWDGYDAWLDSSSADLNNISTKPGAGAVVAALFLRRFVTPGIPWVHLDLYAWNDTNRPGRPEGGEAQALRAVCRAIEMRLDVMTSDRNTPVT
jgi:leucyl aminopeptidase